MNLIRFNHIILILLCIAGYHEKSFSQNRGIQTSLIEKINSIPSVFVKEIKPLSGFKEASLLALVQPVDHDNPDGAKFTQRIYINHLDYSRPVVLETNGYDVPWHKKRELSKLLNANQIIVEHRYFGQSTPKPQSGNI